VSGPFLFGACDDRNSFTYACDTCVGCTASQWVKQIFSHGAECNLPVMSWITDTFLRLAER